MSRRVVNNVNQARYRECNKLFADLRSGDLIQISVNTAYTNKIKVRAITKNNKGKFAYSRRTTFPRNPDFYTWINNDQIGLYLGRYDGNAVVLINEGLYSCPVVCINKVKGNNEE